MVCHVDEISTDKLTMLYVTRTRTHFLYSTDT